MNVTKLMKWFGKKWIELKKMISEGSCDTEDWRKSALTSGIHFKNIFKFWIVLYFDQLNAALVIINNLFKKS